MLHKTKHSKSASQWIFNTFTKYIINFKNIFNIFLELSIVEYFVLFLAQYFVLFYYPLIVLKTFVKT
jgi:hypothetical protein